MLMCMCLTLLLTCLSSSDDVVTAHDGRNGVGLNRSRVVVVAQLDIVNHNGMKTGGGELCLCQRWKKVVKEWTYAVDGSRLLFSFGNDLDGT